MNQLLEIVEDLRGKVEMPEIQNPYLRTVWIMGRNAGAAMVRNHVRHKVSEPLRTLKVAPKAVRQEMGPVAADVWINGYNAPVEFVQMKINAFLFRATHGQVMVAQR